MTRKIYFSFPGYKSFCICSYSHQLPSQQKEQKATGNKHFEGKSPIDHIIEITESQIKRLNSKILEIEYKKKHNSIKP